MQQPVARILRPNIQSEQWAKHSAAYLQNVAMSLLYLSMLKQHRSDKGQSMTIAVCKCIGTLTPTIYGTLEGNWFILVTGIICFVFDIIYILSLAGLKRTAESFR